MISKNVTRVTSDLHCNNCGNVTRQPGSLRRKLLILAVAIAIFFLIAIAAGVAVSFSPLLTRYVEGNAFRIAMEEETAKGLHFPQARYAPIRRTGVFTAASDIFLPIMDRRR